MSEFYRGIVTNNSDPDRRKRVRLRVPAAMGPAETGWAEPMGPGIVPAVGEQVLVTFEAGATDRVIYMSSGGGEHEHPGLYPSIGDFEGYVEATDALIASNRSDFDGHVANTTNAHGADTAPTPNSLARRTTSGRLAVGDPAADDQAVPRGFADGRYELKGEGGGGNGDLEAHIANTTDAHGASTAATAETIARRTTAGRLFVGDPSLLGHALNLGAADGRYPTKGDFDSHVAETLSPHGADWNPTASTIARRTTAGRLRVGAAAGGDHAVNRDFGDDRYELKGQGGGGDPPSGGTITVHIPGDFPTFQAAIDHFSTQRVARNTTIRLHAASGHRPNSGIYVENGDFSQFEITSVGTLRVGTSWGSNTSFMYGRNAALPVLDTLVNMDNRGLHGIRAYNCRVYIRGGNWSTVPLPTRNTGIYNARECGIYADNSQVWAEGTRISDCGTRNLDCASSLVDVRSSYMRYAGEIGIRASYSSNVRATFCDLRNAGQEGVNCVRSTVVVEASNMRFAGTDGIRATRGGRILAQPNIDPCWVGDCGRYGVSLLNGSFVDFREGIATNCGQEALYMLHGSHVTATNASFHSNTTRACRISGGSLFAHGASFNGQAVSDVVMFDGAVVTMQSASGATNVQTLTLDARGIVFR